MTGQESQWNWKIKKRVHEQGSKESSSGLFFYLEPITHWLHDNFGWGVWAKSVISHLIKQLAASCFPSVPVWTSCGNAGRVSSLCLIHLEGK